MGFFFAAQLLTFVKVQQIFAFDEYRQMR